MINRDKPFSQIKKEQINRETDFLSSVVGEAQELKTLAGREIEMEARRNEILFKVTTEMEDTKAALKEAEALVERLRKHLDQLVGMYKILTKK